MKKSLLSFLIYSAVLVSCIFATDGYNVCRENSLVPEAFLNSFFNSNDYKIETYSMAENPYILAYNVIGTVRDVVNYDKLPISDKALIYQFINGRINILLVIDKNKVSTKDKLLIDIKMPQSFYGWHIKVHKEPLKVCLQPFADYGRNTTDSIDFRLNKKGEFERINYMELYKNQY